MHAKPRTRTRSTRKPEAQTCGNPEAQRTKTTRPGKRPAGQQKPNRPKSPGAHRTNPNARKCSANVREMFGHVRNWCALPPPPRPRGRGGGNAGKCQGNVRNMFGKCSENVRNWWAPPPPPRPRGWRGGGRKCSEMFGNVRTCSEMFGTGGRSLPRPAPGGRGGGNAGKC